MSSIVTEEEIMFFDTDCGGVVHNIAYLRFIETARTRLLAKLGLDLKQISRSQLFPAVTRTEIDYRKPAVLGDRLITEASIEYFERVRFSCTFRILRAKDEALMITCKQSLALVQMPEGRPRRLPKEWFIQYPELTSHLKA
ncbi:MAG: thioesterase family protein [Verrucomicrobiota bacterium]